MNLANLVPTGQRIAGHVHHRVPHVERRPRMYASVVCSASATKLPQKLETIVTSFQAVPDPMQRYKQLLFFATKLEPLAVEFKTEENKVKGCVSQVWMVPDLQEDGTVHWKADSDSQLTKGLAALLVQGLSGITPQEIIQVQPEFITSLGLQQSLTPSRNNGFLNMFKLMQSKALELCMSNVKSGQNINQADSQQETEQPAQEATMAAADAPASKPSSTPVADSMRRKLEQQLAPTRLVIKDESEKHASHASRMGSASDSGETHFSMEIVSSKFEGLTSIKRHRLVYSILDEEMGNPVHALTLVTKTPAEV